MDLGAIARGPRSRRSASRQWAKPARKDASAPRAMPLTGATGVTHSPEAIAPSPVVLFPALRNSEAGQWPPDAGSSYPERMQSHRVAPVLGAPGSAAAACYTCIGVISSLVWVGVLPRVGHLSAIKARTAPITRLWTRAFGGLQIWRLARIYSRTEACHRTPGIRIVRPLEPLRAVPHSGCSAFPRLWISRVSGKRRSMPSRRKEGFPCACRSHPAASVGSSRRFRLGSVNASAPAPPLLRRREAAPHDGAGRELQSLDGWSVEVSELPAASAARAWRDSPTRCWSAAVALDISRARPEELL